MKGNLHSTVCFKLADWESQEATSRRTEYDWFRVFSKSEESAHLWTYLSLIHAGKKTKQLGLSHKLSFFKGSMKIKCISPFCLFLRLWCKYIQFSPPHPMPTRRTLPTYSRLCFNRAGAVPLSSPGLPQWSVTSLGRVTSTNMLVWARRGERKEACFCVIFYLTLKWKVSVSR